MCDVFRIEDTYLFYRAPRKCTLYTAGLISFYMDKRGENIETDLLYFHPVART